MRPRGPARAGAPCIQGYDIVMFSGPQVPPAQGSCPGLPFAWPGRIVHRHRGCGSRSVSVVDDAESFGFFVATAGPAPAPRGGVSVSWPVGLAGASATGWGFVGRGGWLTPVPGPAASLCRGQCVAKLRTKRRSDKLAVVAPPVDMDPRGLGRGPIDAGIPPVAIGVRLSLGWSARRQTDACALSAREGVASLPASRRSSRVGNHMTGQRRDRRGGAFRSGGGIA